MKRKKVAGNLYKIQAKVEFILRELIDLSNKIDEVIREAEE